MLLCEKEAIYDYHIICSLLYNRRQEMGNILIIGILLFLIVATAGGIILTVVVNRKWGYTPEREQELEKKTGGSRS